MTRPDWKRAPKWAQWLAMDASGAWYWFAEKPARDDRLGMFCAGSEQCEAVRFDGWENSLECRPSLAPAYRLTAKAEGFAYAELIADGWDNETLLLYGLMERLEC